jgi:hypothetical protein
MTEPASKNKAFVSGAKPAPRALPNEGRSHGVLRTTGPVLPPSAIESLLPVFGPMVEAGYEFNQGHPAMGVADMGVAIADGAALMDPVAWGARAVKDAIQRGITKQMGLSWTQRAVRGRLQTAGLVRKAMKVGLETIPGQELHHIAIPHGGWGKTIPDQIKNASWNLKALEQETHRRIHTAFNGKPRFNPIERTWHGTSGPMKRAAAVVVAHGAKVAATQVDGKEHVR